MPPHKRSAGSALLSAKRPRLPVPPEEHDYSQTDGSEISFRALTALSTSTRSSQSTSTRSSQSTTAPIARKGLLRSSDISTGRSSPRRVEFHLPDGNTESAEVQKQQEDVPEVEETADTSHSEYDDSPENDHESSEENLDDPEEEPQASTQRSQGTGKRPRTVQPSTARAVDDVWRRPTGAVAEVIASSDVSVDVVQGNTTGGEENIHHIPENAHRIPESVDFGTQPGSISESIPGISETFPGVSESTPDTLTVNAFFKHPVPIPVEHPAAIPTEHPTYRLRFLAPEIIDILYYKYFDGVRMRGVKDPEFLEQITPTFICLISTAIWHGIRAWSTGTYVKPGHFQSQNENVKGRSRQNQEATLEVIKDNLREKIREKKGITIEVILEDGFSEDDEALAADLATFRNARKAPPSALVDPLSSDNGSSQEEVVHAQLRGIEAEEEGEENEEEQEEGDHEGGEEEEDSTGSALEASALKSTGSALEASALESTGSALEASALESTSDCFGAIVECFGDGTIESRFCMLFREVPTKAKSSMPGKNRALKGKTRCVAVRQLQQAISGAVEEVSSAPVTIWSAPEALAICSGVVRELQEQS
ncbi:hypothetical protein DFP73DRAFT_600012 [Morchella snyderi]|nr:hypothetical protein DFP73DRAFT_600012 [Morchella snyderi]